MPSKKKPTRPQGGGLHEAAHPQARQAQVAFALDANSAAPEQEAVLPVRRLAVPSPPGLDGLERQDGVRPVKKEKKPESKFTEEQREAFRYLWPDMVGGKKRETLEEQFQREMTEEKR